MTLLDASNATQRDLTANVLTLTSKLELANTKIDTLQSIIQDNSNATEAKLTRFSQSVGEVKAAIQEVQRPPQDFVVAVIKDSVKSWMDGDGAPLLHGYVAQAMKEAREDIASTKLAWSTQGRDAIAAANHSSQSATLRVPTSLLGTSSASHHPLVNVRQPSSGVPTTSLRHRDQFTFSRDTTLVVLGLEAC